MSKISHGDKTKQRILDAAVELWPNIGARNIANHLKITHAAVLYHFPGEALRVAAATHAIDKGNSRVIVQLIANRHPIVKNMSQAEKNKHMQAVS